MVNKKLRNRMFVIDKIYLIIFIVLLNVILNHSNVKNEGVGCI